MHETPSVGSIDQNPNSQLVQKENDNLIYYIIYMYVRPDKDILCIDPFMELNIPVCLLDRHRDHNPRRHIDPLCLLCQLLNWSCTELFNKRVLNCMIRLMIKKMRNHICNREMSKRNVISLKKVSKYGTM